MQFKTGWSHLINKQTVFGEKSMLYFQMLKYQNDQNQLDIRTAKSECLLLDQTIKLLQLKR